MRHRWRDAGPIQVCSRCCLRRKRVWHYDTGNANRMRHRYNVWMYWTGTAWRWIRTKERVPECPGHYLDLAPSQETT